MVHKNVNNNSILEIPLEEAQSYLKKISPQKRLEWAFEKFGEQFIITTSFGIQSAVLLHMIHGLKSNIKVIWVDTGYLPQETYQYAELLIKKLNLNLKVVQSHMSPARMEALYGKLWDNNSIKDLEKYHLIRKVNPLEETLQDLNVHCWASGVRKGQTDHRRTMTLLDLIRNRLSLRPILEWTPKDVFYYMEENNLPQHPLFEKGFSTVGDWHSSAPDGPNVEGRDTRFGGLKQECGMHMPNETEGE